MPIRQGYEAGTVLQSGQVTNGLSGDLNDYQFDEWNPSAFMVCDRVEYDSGSRFGLLCARSAATAKTGYRLLNWADDFYDRVYITPTLIDLGTVASPQTRPVELWNAWRNVQAQLASIDIAGTLVSVIGNGTPYTLRPLQYTIYNVSVGSTGAPEVNAQITFNFSNVPDPGVVLVLGTRAVRFKVVPEVPVSERWKWLTDIMVATDGTEQRMAVAGEVPRVDMDVNTVFTSQDEVNEFYAQLLSSAGRLWVPEYQYATRTTAAAAVDSVTVYCDTNATDIRAGEYALIDTRVIAFLAEVEAVGDGFLTLVSPLDFGVPKGSLVAPGAPCLLDDGTTLNRYAVDWAGKTHLSCRLQRYRSALMRPGVAEVMATYKGSKVLERRSLAPGLVNDSFITGQEMQDNQTGIVDMIVNWDYTRIGGSRQFKVNRVKQPSEMDYWREFFSWCRGRARMFWMPSWRNDFTFVSPPLEGGSTATIKGNDYALKLWLAPTHRHLEIATAAGIHRCEVTNAVDSGGDSGINFDPPLPTGEGWGQITRTSLLLPLRLNSDEVEWEHYGLESFVDIAIRTAEVQP